VSRHDGIPCLILVDGWALSPRIAGPPWVGFLHQLSQHLLYQGLTGTCFIQLPLHPASYALHDCCCHASHLSITMCIKNSSVHITPPQTVHWQIMWRKHAVMQEPTSDDMQRDEVMRVLIAGQCEQSSWRARVPTALGGITTSSN